MNSLQQNHDNNAAYAYYEQERRVTAKPNASDLQSIASQLGQNEEIEISYKVSRRSTAPAPATVQACYAQPERDYSSIEYASSEINTPVVMLFVIVGLMIGGAMAVMQQIAGIAAMLAAAGYPAIILAVALGIGCIWLAKEITSAVRK